MLDALATLGRMSKHAAHSDGGLKRKREGKGEGSRKRRKIKSSGVERRLEHEIDEGNGDVNAESDMALEEFEDVEIPSDLPEERAGEEEEDGEEVGDGDLGEMELEGEGDRPVPSLDQHLLTPSCVGYEVPPCYVSVFYSIDGCSCVRVS